MFSSDTLRMPGGTKYTAIAPTIEWGTAIKLFEYKMKGLTTNIKFDPYYAISLKLPQPGLPVRFHEFRNYRQESPVETMAGLLVRLQDDKGDNIEDGFPNSYPIHIMGEPMKIDVYAFKRNSADKRYRKGEGIIFTINGQSHGAFSKRFFTRQKVKMDYLKDSILVIADASNLSTLAREDLFMNSRDRLSEGELRDAIEDELERIVREDPLLKDLREKRRREAIADKISDNKPLHDVLDKIIKKSPSLAALFITGKDLGNPFKSVAANISKDPFVGMYYPTYFRLMKKHKRRNKRPINRKRIQFQFETDAVNDYLTRESDASTFDLFCNGRQVRDITPNLLNGVVTLNIWLSDEVNVGDELHYIATVNDETQIEPFVNEFEVIVTDEVNRGKSEPGERKPKAGEEEGNRTRPGGLELPDPTEVYEVDWEKRDFDKFSALSVMNTGNDGYDYFINMDNLYLKSELKAQKANEDPKLLQTKFKTAMVLLGMMILKETSDGKDPQYNLAMSPGETVANFTSMVAPVILPMIDSLGDLQIEE